MDAQPRPAPEGHGDLSPNWVGAGHLKIGDKIKQADGTNGLVANVTTIQQTREMFNLTVSEAHTYYVGQDGWLVHNCDPVTDFLAKKFNYSGPMAPQIQALEYGFPKKQFPIGPILPKDYALTPDQLGALGENAQLIISKTIPSAKDVQSIINQVSNPRFRFIDQVPGATEALRTALKSFPEALKAFEKTRTGR